MKALLFILVIGNLMLLGLAFAPDPDAPGEVFVPPTPPGVHKLQLLSERAVPQPEPAEPANVPPAEQVAEQVASTEDEVPVAEEPEPQAEEDVVASAEEVVEPEPPSPPEPVCHTIGPFAQKSATEGLVKQLEERDAMTDMRQSEIQEPSGYWVYLPSMKKAEADRIVQSLVDNEISDYFVGAQNYISLGIYSVQETAQERYEQITELGFAPKLEQRFKVRDVFWLDVEEPAPPFLTEEDWAELLADNPGVRHQSLACE